MISEFLQRHKAGVLMLSLVSFSLFCLALRIEPYIIGLKTTVWFLVSPEIVYSGQFFSRLDGLGGRLFQLIRVEGENVVLKEQNARLAKWKAERDLLEEENNRLRQLLDLKQKSFPDAVAAEVIGAEVSDWFQSILINKGLKDNVAVSAAVVAASGDRPILVGRVAEVRESASKVLLLTDSLSAISAVVARTGNIGLLEGRGSPWVFVNYLPQRSDVREGDEILTVGLGGVFPPGIPIGQVASVSQSEDGFFRQAKVTPYIDFGSVRDVLVLQRGDVSAPEPRP